MSLDSSVAEISAAGIVTPKAVGTASVTARYVMHNEIASSPVAITVRNPRIEIVAWDNSASKWSSAGSVAAVWGSRLSDALANAARPGEVQFGEGDAAVPCVFYHWSAVAPAANENPLTYAGAALADADKFEEDGKKAYVAYRIKSCSVSFKVWDSGAWVELKDGRAAAYVRTYNYGELFDNTGISAFTAPAGYGFAGWASFADASASAGMAVLSSTNEYASGTTVVKADVTLYAVYEEESLLVSGIFSVSANKTVQFAKGNLYWNGSAFAMEANQYDYRTRYRENDDNGRVVINGQFAAIENNGSAGLFCWSFNRAATYTLPCSNEGAEEECMFALMNGWAIDGYDILRKAEWEYLLGTRDNAADKWCLVSVAGVTGLVILPDDCPFDAGNSIGENIGYVRIHLFCHIQSPDMRRICALWVAKPFG